VEAIVAGSCPHNPKNPMSKTTQHSSRHSYRHLGDELASVQNAFKKEEVTWIEMEIGKIGRIEEVGTVDEKGDWNDI
jgi:hypothetical protein